jgi:hypothetical protein
LHLSSLFQGFFSLLACLLFVKVSGGGGIYSDFLKFNKFLIQSIPEQYVNFLL